MDFLLNAINQFQRTHGQDERHAELASQLKDIHKRISSDQALATPNPGHIAAIQGAGGSVGEASHTQMAAKPAPSNEPAGKAMPAASAAKPAPSKSFADAKNAAKEMMA